MDHVEKYDEKILQNQKLLLMLSQIKPHFFFNTITTIQALCNIDPIKAAETLGLFASYVRHNITTQTENLIPFSEEVKHVNTYVAIEMLRFHNIEVLYDFQVTNFDIVDFSLQPLVENAIKHGIRSREQLFCFLCETLMKVLNKFGKPSRTLIIQKKSLFPKTLLLCPAQDITYQIQYTTPVSDSNFQICLKHSYLAPDNMNLPKNYLFCYIEYNKTYFHIYFCVYKD